MYPNEPPIPMTLIPLLTSRGRLPLEREHWHEGAKLIITIQRHCTRTPFQGPLARWMGKVSMSLERTGASDVCGF